jgi:hypothetical protein
VVAGQNDSRFGQPPARPGEKSAFTALPPWWPGKTTVVSGSRRLGWVIKTLLPTDRRLGRVIKALLPADPRLVRAKRQSFWGAAGSTGVKKRFCRVTDAVPE